VDDLAQFVRAAWNSTGQLTGTSVQCGGMGNNQNISSWN